MANDQKHVPTVDRVKLRKDLQTIMDELDSTASNMDAYSPYMWRRLQTTADTVATAINAVRLHLAGMPAGDIASQLHLKKHQVAAYVAWNTMYQPDWPQKNLDRKLKEHLQKIAKAEAKSVFAECDDE
jgi:hypothetical protein